MGGEIKREGIPRGDLTANETRSGIDVVYSYHDRGTVSSKFAGKQYLIQGCQTVSNLEIWSLSIASILARIIVWFTLCFASATTKKEDFHALAIVYFAAVRS